MTDTTQHEAATLVARGLVQGGFLDVRTVRPLDGSPTVVLTGLSDCGLSVTVEILQP